MSSGAAQFGSPLSGGYAGAKAAIRFMTAYAAEESTRAGLGIRFISVLPRLTAATDLGAAAVAAYANRVGVNVDQYVKEQGATLRPDDVAKRLAELARSSEYAPGAYLLTQAGLSLLA